MEGIVFIIVMLILVMLGYYAGVDKANEDIKKRDIASDMYIKGYTDGANDVVKRIKEKEMIKYRELSSDIVNDINSIIEKTK